MPEKNGLILDMSKFSQQWAHHKCACHIVMTCNLFRIQQYINPLNAKLNPICHLLALLGGATIVVVSRLRVKLNRSEW